MLDLIIQATLSGLLIGGVYGLFAMGLTLVFGVMDFVNFAHGSFVMLAMYVSYFAWSLWNIDPILSIPLSVLVLVVVGVVTYQGMFKKVAGGSHMPQLLLSLGLSLLLESGMQILFKPDVRSVQTSYSGDFITVGPAFLGKAQLFAFLVALAATLALSFFLTRTDMGRAMRAVVNDKGMAQMLGINSNSIHLLAFGIGAALAGIAGSVILTYYPASPHVGHQFIVLGFVAVVLGGMGNAMGAFIGGLFIGVIQQLSAAVISVDLQNVFIFVLFILLLVVRPSGLFGKEKTA